MNRKQVQKLLEPANLEQFLAKLRAFSEGRLEYNHAFGGWVKVPAGDLAITALIRNPDLYRIATKPVEWWEVRSTRDTLLSSHASEKEAEASLNDSITKHGYKLVHVKEVLP